MGPDIRAEFQEAIYEDVKGYLGIEGLCSVAEKNHLVSWKQIMNRRENDFYENEMISDTEIEKQIEKIMGFASVTEEDAMALDSFFSQIKKRLENGDKFFWEEMIGKCSGINWFYNWVIYTLMVIQIQVDYRKAEATTFPLESCALIYSESYIEEYHVTKALQETETLYEWLMGLLESQKVIQ